MWLKRIVVYFLYTFHVWPTAMYQRLSTYLHIPYTQKVRTSAPADRPNHPFQFCVCQHPSLPHPPRPPWPSPSRTMPFWSKFSGASAAAAPPPANAPITVATASVSVRLDFLRKVYVLLTINFAITIGISCAFTFIRPIRDFFVGKEYLIFVAIAVTFVAFLILRCVKPPFPLNIVMLYVFTLAWSCFIAIVVASYYSRGYGFAVLAAFISTAAVFLTITVYVSISKKDFSFLYGFLSAGLVVLLVLLLLTFVVGFDGKQSRWLYFGISLLGALLMTGYLLYDTSMIITRYGPDQWLDALLALYLDVTNLFLYLLAIFSFVSD